MTKTRCLQPHTFKGHVHRCRKCVNCLIWRADQWSRRSETEWSALAQNWWVTLTFKPGTDWATVDARAAYFLKKIRAVDPYMRYLALKEAGERKGRIHFHIFIVGSPDLTKRMVEKAWTLGGKRLGFTRVTLCNKAAGVARYLTEYISDSMTLALGRLRASKHWGMIAQPRHVPVRDSATYRLYRIEDRWAMTPVKDWYQKRGFKNAKAFWLEADEARRTPLGFAFAPEHSSPDKQWWGQGVPL